MTGASRRGEVVVEAAVDLHDEDVPTTRDVEVAVGEVDHRQRTGDRVVVARPGPGADLIGVEITRCRSAVPCWVGLMVDHVGLLMRHVAIRLQPVIELSTRFRTLRVIVPSQRGSNCRSVGLSDWRGQPASRAVEGVAFDAAELATTVAPVEHRDLEFGARSVRSGPVRAETAARSAAARVIDSV